VVVVVLLVLDSFSLMRPQILEIGLGLVGAIAIASFGRAVAVALFAPSEPDRRLPRLDDQRAKLLADHLTLATRILGVIIFINMLHRATVAPVVSTIATSALMAALLLAALIHLLWRIGRLETVAEARGQWLRGAGWIVVAIVAAALATGYIGFAAFLTARVVIILAALGALYVLVAFTDALFSEVLTGDTAKGRAVASFFGIKPRSVELIGTLVSAIIRVLLILVVIFPLLGPWGIFAADFVDVLREAVFGFRVGDITISLGAIIAAFLLVLVGIFVTRAAQRWMQTRFLPRTSLEPSLQHSVSVIFGYVGVVVALAIALGVLGIDLQKITLVAGALSIGIGFGLQSVVSNFVSGLILLTERPIRVGDMIVVKGEEGFVRRIRVRATEIETFERASVIVPNSELITGVVKNWTHANTLGRIIVNVNVSYDSDAEAARDILLAIAREHAQILQSPPPVAQIAGFGDWAIKLELIGVVGNVTQAGSVKSEIYFTILRRFREAGIEIPYPQQETRTREPRDRA
jgi:small-conductance mechanosensitive channel